MSESRILSELSKRGGWSKYHRKFSNLTDAAKRIALSLIQNNMPVDEAIKTAKRSVTAV